MYALRGYTSCLCLIMSSPQPWNIFRLAPIYCQSCAIPELIPQVRSKNFKEATLISKIDHYDLD